MTCLTDRRGLAGINQNVPGLRVAACTAWLPVRTLHHMELLLSDKEHVVFERCTLHSSGQHPPYCTVNSYWRGRVAPTEWKINIEIQEGMLPC